MPVRLILADDHEVVRQGLRVLLEQQADFSVVADVRDGRQAVDLAMELKPDVVIMDVSLPVLNGVEATRQIREKRQETAVLALTVHCTNGYIGQMLKAGAAGYLLKDCTVDELALGIRTVAGGRTYLCAAAADLVVAHYVRGEQERTTQEYENLTPREREVLQLLAEGYATRQIANQLKISVKTIDTHRYQLMRKLKLRGVADLTRFALREGISSLDR